MYKVIIQGRLDFGNENTYAKALKLYVQRKDGYYKNEVIFSKPEEHFIEEKFHFQIKRYVQYSSDKYWMNTVHLLQNLAQYAIAGNISMWMMHEGKAIRKEIITPSNEKSINNDYKKALKIQDTPEKQAALNTLLDTILEKYPEHAQALAMKGRYFARQRDIKKAVKYFDRAIEADEDNSLAYLWKGKMFMALERYDEALTALQKSVEISVAQESHHWTGRRLKGLCYYRLENWEDCTFEWRLFVKRPFEKGDSNYYWKRAVMVGFGRANLQQGKKGEAVLAFDQALDLDSLFDNIPQEVIAGYRDQALGKSGVKAPAKTKATRAATKVSK